jgi:hypothetical protein
MRRALRIHPDGDRGPVVRIEADVRRPGPAVLALAYELTGQTADLRIPPPAPPGPADGLWKHTCFEAFVSLGEGRGYLEFNLSPSGQWAAYRFSDYRADMAPMAELPPPAISLASRADGLVLKTELDLSAVTDLPPDAPWRLGLAAVTEDAQGRIGYWALAHPPGKPDFHHLDGFACEVRPPEAA